MSSTAGSRRARTVLLVLTVTACGDSVGSRRPPPPAPAAPPAAPAPAGRPHPRVELDGVRLALDPRVARAATPARVAACPLADPTHKPDGIAPAHLAFVLSPTPTPAPPSGPCEVPALRRPGLYVFSVDAFRHELPSTAAAFTALRALLDGGALAPGDEPPFVPFVDASFALAERVTLVDFAGGRGVLFLGQLSIEPDTLGDDLVYVFQALDADDRTYVLGLFPATTTSRVPPFQPPPGSYEATYTAFDRYTADVADLLTAAPDTALDPDPNSLRSMLATLELPPTTPR